MEVAEKFTDINKFFKDLLFLRNAVQVLFDEKQYAALNFVGRRIEELDNIYLSKQISMQNSGSAKDDEEEPNNSSIYDSQIV